MLNQAVLVGRIVQTPELRETENGKKLARMTLAVPRSFKNSNGEYETDFISCVMWKGVAESTVEYCQTGDLVGIKGRIQSRKIETDEEHKRQLVEVVAEKVTFLSRQEHDHDQPRYFCRWVNPAVQKINHHPHGEQYGTTEYMGQKFLKPDKNTKQDQNLHDKQQ